MGKPFKDQIDSAFPGSVQQLQVALRVYNFDFELLLLTIHLQQFSSYCDRR